MDVRLNISIGSLAVRNLDFEVTLDTSIAGIGQISQFAGVTSFPYGGEMPAISLEGKDNKGAAVTVPLVPTQGLAQIAPRYRVHCDALYSNTVLHLIIASIALNQATQGRLPERLFAPKRTPRVINLKGTFEANSRPFPIEFEKRFEIPEAEEKPNNALPSEPEPTLLSLMDSSFPHLNKLWGKPIIQFEHGSSLQVTSALYFDLFTSGAKFLGFHIPKSSHALEACDLPSKNSAN